MQRGLLAHQLFHGIDGVEAARPEVLVVPRVLANGDGKANAVELDHLLGFGRREVTLLVKDVVKRQEPLVLFEKQLAFVEKNGGVEGWLSVLSVRRKGDAGEHGYRQLARRHGQFVHGRSAPHQEAGFLKEVGGRIAADGELGEDREARAPLRCAVAGGNNFLEITRKITDRGVDLGQRNLHSSILNREASQPRPLRPPHPSRTKPAVSLAYG